MQETITGSGQLKIDGVPMDISLTVPKALCLPEALLPDAQQFAYQLTDVAVARVERAGHRISCVKGCGAYCRQMVPISPPEARHLARLVAAPGLPSPWSGGGWPGGLPGFFGQLFWTGGAVSISGGEKLFHPSGPAAGLPGISGDVTPPAACGALGAGQVKQIPVPSRVWAGYARSTSADGGLEWMPLIEALDYVAKREPPCAGAAEFQTSDSPLRPHSREARPSENDTVTRFAVMVMSSAMTIMPNQSLPTNEPILIHSPCLGFAPCARLFNPSLRGRAHRVPGRPFGAGCEKSARRKGGRQE